MLSELGRREEALQAAEEATHTRRQLAQARPDAFLPDLAMSLNNLGTDLSELGRREEALEAAEEAAGLYRQLAQARPDAFLPDLARSLGTLGACRRAATKARDAEAAFSEGIRALLPAFLRLPAAYGGLMSALVRDYLSLAAQLGEAPDKDLLGPIVAAFQQMETANKARQE
jgi:tetratricopeptide (TPR) repeat protein